MSNDNSDYNKPRTNLFDLLPEVYQSDTNRSIFENLFNRFLTKQETERVSGYIGDGNPEAVVKRQIQEFNVHRQGYQLQPIIYNKVGSVEWMSSWKDILNQAERQGIDPERVQEWMSLLKFNWVPPIDLDKLIHYRDYYWVDEDNPTSSPQYMTIRSRCTTAQAYLNFIGGARDEILNKNGSMPLRAQFAGIAEDIPGPYDIVEVSATTNSIIVSGDVTEQLSNAQLFRIELTNFNDGTYEVQGVITYDAPTDRSTIPVVVGSLPTDELATGRVELIQYDKLIVSGEFARPFEAGFVFYYKESTNPELNNSFWQVVASEYDQTANETVIQINTRFSRNIADGILSLDEAFAIASAEKDCTCSGSVGWDIFQWDDNPANPSIWFDANDGEDLTSLITSISNTGSPTVAGTDGQLWWDTDGDILYQYGEELGAWKSLWSNFSLVVEQTLGVSFWDLAENCDTALQTTTSGEQWIEQNKWVHKTDVKNFSTVQAATLPIIEYSWDLELNEWNYTTFQWKYRGANLIPFEMTDASPEYIEIVQIIYYGLDTPRRLILDERYGDLTDYFTPGREFMISTQSQVLVVESSTFRSENPGEPGLTRVTVTENITVGPELVFGAPAQGATPATVTINTNLADVAPLRPTTTSLGDGWKGYDIHWLLVDESETTVPVPHQPQNPYIDIDPAAPTTIHPSGLYDIRQSYYAQESKILTTTSTPLIELSNVPLPSTTRNLQQRALLGANDIRVYVNGLRQYGTYNEVTTSSKYVNAIQFFPGYEPQRFDIVRIEVGEATPADFGLTEVNIRTEEDDIVFQTEGTVIRSLVAYRKAEQVKTSDNQYPLFDMYKVDGSPLYDVSPLFSFVTSPTAPANRAVGLRVVVDDAGTEYLFEQHLVKEDNGIMYAYRDYASRTHDIWVDTDTNIVRFWDGLGWSESTQIGLYYLRAVVSDLPPPEGSNLAAIDGLYWLDTANGLLKRREGNEWPVVPNVLYSPDDESLQTIWRKGLNDEHYIPQKRDWLKRTEEEYNAQRDLYVEELAQEFIAAEPTLPPAEATALAEFRWHQDQANHLSTDGTWIGDWEIPDPLYFNHNRENRRQIKTSELLTHFNTIIDAQPNIPGYNKSRSDMFHLIPTNEVNYGLGGKIREYNYGFDTFLSSMFINEVSPRTLIEFAQDQYDAQLNTLAEVYRKDAVDLFTNTTDDALDNLSRFVADNVIASYEQSDAAGLIYGDTTAFRDVPGADDIGVRNWIGTLPIFGIADKSRPHKIVDAARDVNQVSHHDGHRADYILADGILEGLIRQILDAPDPRVDQGPNQEPAPFGILKVPPQLPPNDVDEFEIEYDTLITDRRGVYWYYVNGTDRVLYRFIVQEIGDNAPASSLPDGTLWLDLTPSFQALRIKQTNPNTGDVEWAVPQGIVAGDSPIRLHNGTDPSDVTTATVSAWQPIDLNDILSDVLVEVERRLYEVVPEYNSIRYDAAATQEQYPALFEQLLEDQFDAYVSEREIVNQYGSQYEATDPFTWNYRYSTHGRPFDILGVDQVLGELIIAGQFASTFDQLITGSVPFYVKNSGENDGEWIVTAPCTEECIAGSNTNCPAYGWSTRIPVARPADPQYVDNQTLADEETGVVYTGVLPSPANNGSESGGDWRDYYEKLYGTPYPHLEPWKLQGYRQKPQWWDEEYANNDPEKWGDRRWKYKHGFEITGVNPPMDIFEIDGDFREVFPTLSTFDVDRSPDHQGTWTVGKLGDVSNVNTGPAGVASLELVDGINNRTSDFPAGMRFSVVSASGQVVKQLTVSATVFTGPPSNINVIVVEEAIDDATDFVFFGGATYDAVSNATSIRINTNVGDITVAQVSGRITRANGMDGYGMWRNIRLGHIPPGRAYPNGIVGVTGIPNTDRVIHDLEVPDLRPYRYFSVNIDNVPITTGGSYDPDDVFPPYWDYNAHFGTPPIPPFDRAIRSQFAFQSTEIRAESADFVFGDAGPIEWEWRSSSQFLYDLLTVSFRIDPIRLWHNIFGPEYHTIAGLFIDKRQERTLAHGTTDFHGDVVNTNEVVEYNGTNQWYINYLRRAGVDLSMSDFRTSWTNWTAPMTYQFSSFVDTPSLSVAHRRVCISEFDYRIASKRSLGVEDYWADSFDVHILSMPPRIARYDNEGAWSFEVHTKPPYGRDIEYYDVQQYQFYVDPATDLMTIYSWPVTDMNYFSDTFSVSGDQTKLFTNGRTFSVVESTDNDGAYTIISSAYDLVTDQTIINVDENVDGVTKDGRIILDYRSLPWEDGEGVALSTHEILPIPLSGDTQNGVYLYFIIRQYDSQGVAIPNTFRLARTQSDALNGSHVDVTTVGRGNHFVGKVQTTFDVAGIPTFWKTYVVDTTNVLEMTAPEMVTGMQNMVNIMLGYQQRQQEQGWRYNPDNTLRDFTDTSYAVSWQHEIRRFIKYSHQVRTSQTKRENRYPVTVDINTDTWTIVDGSVPFYVTGDPVTVHSSNRVYPSPLFHGGRYYIIRDDVGVFRLAATKRDAQAGIPMNITNDLGVGDMFLMDPAVLTKTAPKFEINPFRNALWFRPERGIVSNLLGSNATVDTFSTPILSDQYGRPLSRSDVRIFREDKQTKITAENFLDNDVELTRVFRDPYNYIHIGSCHLFVDTYEHVLIFNNKTTEDALLYDPFIGLNVTKFEMLYNRQQEFTQRPNVGGQYYLTENNQGAELERNIEASIEDLRNLYDTYRVIEANDFVEQSRKTLGYDGTTTYLDNLNLSAKSQFAFWRGQIQHKGAMNSIESFVNSRRFIDAKVDEFWAVKIPGATFGSRGDKEYIGMWLFDEDARNNEFRLQFLDLDNICDAGYSSNEYDSGCGFAYPNEGDAVPISDEGWTAVSITDEARWVDQPDQLIRLINQGGAMYFDLRLEPEMLLKRIDIPTEDSTYGDGSGEYYVRHNFKSDYVTITGRMATPAEYYADITSFGPDGKTVTVPPFVPASGMITVFVADSGCQPTSIAGDATSGCAVAGADSAPSDDVMGPLAFSNVDYEEIITSDFFSTELRFKEDMTDKIIRVVYGTGTLTPELHYEHYTSNIVKILHDEILDGSLIEVKIWGLMFDNASLNPHKIIDMQSETVITPVQYWDPGRGRHYYNAIHIVDLQIDSDPVFYSNTEETDARQRQRIANDLNVAPTDRTSEEPWRSSRVGTTWLDTQQLDHVPYYDHRAIADLEERLLLWGEPAGWSQFKIRTWVESDVPPAEYTGDGTAEQTIYESTGNINDKWAVARNRYDEFDVIMEGNVVQENIEDGEVVSVNVEFTLGPTGFDDLRATDWTLTNQLANEHIEVFVNGIWVPQTLRIGDVDVLQWGVTGEDTFVVKEIQNTDRVRIVQFVPGTRPEDIDPDQTNDALQQAAIDAEELLLGYQYVERKYIDNFGVERSKYYFWVSDLPTTNGRTMSPVSAQTTLETIPIPYVVYHEIEEPKTLEFEGVTTDLPWRFTKAIVRGIRSIVDSDRRYVLRWTRDETLRDTLETGTTALQKKNLHEQWELIRPEMPQTIPRWLWDKVIESVLGFTISTTSAGAYQIDNVRVPTLSRELYDTTYGTDTQYGLGSGQAFTDGTLALDTILKYLNSTDVDFSPVDINVFFQNYEFDTNNPETILEAMNAIYTTFPYVHVNRLFFEVLMDAFSVKAKYEDIFKTSMIALHGIRPFQVGGLFDD